MRMDHAAKELSGTEGNLISELTMIRKPNPFQKEIRHSLKYVKAIKNNLENVNWSQQLLTNTQITGQFLNVMTMLLRFIGLIDCEKKYRA